MAAPERVCRRADSSAAVDAPRRTALSVRHISKCQRVLSLQNGRDRIQKLLHSAACPSLSAAHRCSVDSVTCLCSILAPIAERAALQHSEHETCTLCRLRHPSKLKLHNMPVALAAAGQEQARHSALRHLWPWQRWVWHEATVSIVQQAPSAPKQRWGQSVIIAEQ